MNESTTRAGIPPAQPVPIAAAVTPISYASVPPKPTPVAPSERIATLDILRGVAVLGILVMNIYSFSFPFAEYSCRLWPTHEGFDAALMLILHFFGSHKFLSIFALLFGAGLALQSERAARTGSPFVGMYSRRLTILLLFGILHGVLIWYGDILALYAIIGFAAMLLRNLKTKYMLMLAALVFMVPIAFGILAIIQEHGVIGGQSQYAAPGPFMQKLYELFYREPEIYGYGTYAKATQLRTAMFGWLSIAVAPRYSYGYCLCLFLLGIVLVRKGILLRPDEHRPSLKRFVLYGLAVGCSIEAVDDYLAYVGELPLSLDIVRVFTTRLGPVGMSFAYIGIITLIGLRLRGSRLLHCFASVGRMALTNYIAQSVICTLVFYGYGFGLFGELSRSHALIVAFAVFAAQMIVSPVWLRYFRYGPLEWLWRTLTYMRVQPMCVRCSVREQIPAPTFVHDVRGDETAGV